MGDYIGGCRFKVEQVENGWVVEFQQTRNASHTNRSTLVRYCAGPDVADLMEVLHEHLYREQARLDQADEPTVSQPEDQ